MFPMSTPSLKKPIWIDHPKQLRIMLKDLEQYPLLAVDTESNSLYVYQEQVCLIQFSTGNTDYLVDPLAISDLSPLEKIFSNPNIEKIFHAAEYDLICLKRDFGFRFRNIFDTMVAGRILGRDQVGLGSMLKESFDIDVDKRFQRANWGKRPLSPAQLAYARLDTHYLIELRNRLKTELIEKGWWPLAEEDFRAAEQVTLPDQDPSPSRCFRIPGSQELSPIQLSVLQAVCEYRDEAARHSNLPPFKILSNRVLLEIARIHPQTFQELEQVKELSPRLLSRYGDGLLEAVERGFAAGPIERVHNHNRPAEDFLYRLEVLRSWRKDTGQQLSVPSDVILPRDMLEEIAQANPRNKAELTELMGRLPWRLEKFGDQILGVLVR